MGVSSFDRFVNEKAEKVRLTAGVAIVCNKKLLLVHPTNSGWKKGTCGIPKGKVEPGEDLMEAAIRELLEETGISIRKDQMSKSPETVNFYSKGGTLNGQLTYYVAKIGSPSEIGLSDLKVPKNMLQLEEVDWAKFVDSATAYPIVSRGQLIIIDRLIS